MFFVSVVRRLDSYILTGYRRILAADDIRSRNRYIFTGLQRYVAAGRADHTARLADTVQFVGAFLALLADGKAQAAPGEKARFLDGFSVVAPAGFFGCF